MVITGAIKTADAEKAKKEPLNVTSRPTSAHMFAAEYFAEEVRRWVYEKYGEKTLVRGRPLGPHHARSQAARSWRARH
jgi:penicillin-binding protein 1A